MLRYVVGLFLSLALFNSFAQPQSSLNPVSLPTQAQKMAAQKEAVDISNAEELRQRLEQQLIARAIADRQAALKRDTEKLAALAAELKQSVDKTNANILSLEVIKKAQEIQKLAKSVQDKMKNAY